MDKKQIKELIKSVEEGIQKAEKNKKAAEEHIDESNFILNALLEAKQKHLRKSNL